MTFSVLAVITSASFAYNTNDISLQYEVIPEPSSLALLGGLALLRRRRQA